MIVFAVVVWTLITIVALAFVRDLEDAIVTGAILLAGMSTCALLLSAI